MHQRPPYILTQPMTTIAVNTNGNATRPSAFRTKRLLDDLCDDVYENDVIVSSCIFPKGELLDYDLVPEFSNYIYAFIFMLLPTTGSKNKRSLIVPEGFLGKNKNSISKCIWNTVCRVSF